MKSFKLLAIPALCVTLVACGGGAAGGGESIIGGLVGQKTTSSTEGWKQGTWKLINGEWIDISKIPVPAVDDAELKQAQIAAGVSATSGKISFEHKGITRYFYHGWEVTPTIFNSNNPEAFRKDNDLNTVQGLMQNPDAVVNLNTPDLETPNGTAFDKSVSDAWTEGWLGQDRRIAGTLTPIEIDAPSNVENIIKSKVAPKISVFTSARPDIVIKTGESYTPSQSISVSPVSTNGVVVGSATLVGNFLNQVTGATYKNTLAVKSGFGANNEFGVVSAGNHTEAVSVAGGYVALVMSKFSGLSGADSATLLKRTAIDNNSGGKDLSLPHALSPTGRLN